MHLIYGYSRLPIRVKIIAIILIEEVGSTHILRNISKAQEEEAAYSKLAAIF